jgi:hypothetical protein
MKRSQFRKSYKDHSEKISVEVSPKRSKYVVKIPHAGRITLLTPWFTNKPIYFDNLELVNVVIKKLKIKNHHLDHNFHYTEIGILDHQNNAQPWCNDLLSVSI